MRGDVGAYKNLHGRGLVNRESVSAALAAAQTGLWLTAAVEDRARMVSAGGEYGTAVGYGVTVREAKQGWEWERVEEEEQEEADASCADHSEWTGSEAGDRGQPTQHSTECR